MNNNGQQNEHDWSCSIGSGEKKNQKWNKKEMRWKQINCHGDCFVGFIQSYVTKWMAVKWLGGWI